MMAFDSSSDYGSVGSGMGSMGTGGPCEPHKTPISVLQEICARNNLSPEYHLLQVEGVVHAPTFKFRVRVDDIEATGEGQSKKKAKHNAAMAALEALAQTNLIEGIEEAMEIVRQQQPKEVVDAPEEETLHETNPVGKLQEICMRKRWRPPQYETYGEQGLPHERIFKMRCLIEDVELSQIGEGRSKKLAKRQAASRMLLQLQKRNFADIYADDHSYERRHANLFSDAPEDSNSIKDKYDQYYQFLEDEQCEEVKKLIDEAFNTKRYDQIVIDAMLEDGRSEKEIEAFKMKTEFTLIDVMDYIGDKIKLSSQFYELDHSSNRGPKWQLFLNLTPSDGLFRYPVLTVMSSADTIEEAKLIAVQRALKLLKILIDQPKKDIGYFNPSAAAADSDDAKTEEKSSKA